MKKTIFTAIVVSLLLADGIFGITGAAGGAAPFLRAGVGARGLALGSAFTAYSDDPSVPYWNPAATVYINQMALNTMVSWMTEDRSYNFFNLIYPSQIGSFALNWINFSISGIEGRQTDTEAFTPLSDTENAFFVTYARELTKGFSVGGNLKILSINNSGVPAFGISCDVGVMIRPIPLVQFGVMLQDLANFLNWSTGTTEQIPLDMKIGAKIDALPELLSVSIDAEENEFEGVTLRSGVEASFIKIFFIRAGGYYDIKSYESNYTLGGGIKYQIANFLVQLDYAFLKETILAQDEFDHKLSLAVFF